MKKIKKGLFPFIIAFSALSVSGSAAFYSVYGLSKLFAGASFEVIIMAGSLEVAKLVTASLLYQYWNNINKLLRTYLTVATIVLVLITSMGIYGFLSAAYQDTYRQLTIKENQTSFLEQKRDFYQLDVTRYDEELKRISNNISTLSNAKSQTIQVRDTSVAGGVRTTISTSELRLASKRIEAEEENRKNVQFKREIAADSLQKYQLQILELENNFDVAGELGPLEYLSGLTGTPMDKIINILLLVIIFVFDPLAISLVVAANFAFAKAFPKRKKNLYGEKEQDEDTWEEFIEDETYEATSDKLYDKAIEEAKGSIPDGLEFNKTYTQEEVSEAFKNMDEKRMDIIGQNGNDGLHYDSIEKTLEEPSGKKIEKILKISKEDATNKSSLKERQKLKDNILVQYKDGSQGWIPKKDFKDNPNKIRYF
jgi:hypothetical protein